ncbi:MAG TPA: extensin family protein, partial [Kofleriaceae bacterium]|nr:extensin family protein [Kofleriaceae bacterium]
MSRKVPLSGKAVCPPIELVSYSGTVVRFHKPMRINRPFESHVRGLEQIVHDTAVEVYGRPPSTIVHLGAFYCRRISTWPYLVSEHGLGNAIDIGGVRFDRLAAGSWPEAPSRWRQQFSVGMSQHWKDDGKNPEHARFLRLVARRLIEREGLFRVILGPAHPNHANHLHL